MEASCGAPSLRLGRTDFGHDAAVGRRGSITVGPAEKWISARSLALQARYSLFPVPYSLQLASNLRTAGPQFPGSTTHAATPRGIP